MTYATWPPHQDGHCRPGQVLRNRFYDSEGNAIAKSKEFQLNFLQAFTAIYGALTHDAGSVKVAGWDSGISVFHPANEYVMGTPAPANGWTATVSNRELVATLKHGQKFLSNRISDEENSKPPTRSN